MKNFAAAFLMAMTLVSFQSKPSHALVGLITGNPVLAVAGIVSVTAGIGIYYGDNSYSEEGLANALTGIGIALLDNTSAPEYQFSSLTPSQADGLNVSDADLSIYNHELDQLNAITATIAQEVAQLEQTGKSDQEVVARSSQLWISYASAVSAETYSTAQKIVQKAFSK